jgi:imidazolonepropionase-like amidohydrolase
MYRIIATLVALVVVAACGGGQDTVAIRSVTVIPMTGAGPLEQHTVLIRGDRITALGPDSAIAIPDGATVVDGSGKYLMPGLLEMHAHTSKTRASALGLYVVHGVTTLRDLGSEHAEVLQWRREIRSGKRVGPRMLVAGPYLESMANIERMRRDPVESRVEPFERARIGIGSPEAARRVIDSLAALELDFFKMRTVQDRATYRALNAAADSHGIRFVGHAISGPRLLLESGQDGLEHTFYHTMNDVPRDDRMAFWRTFAVRDIGVVPTLITLPESGLRAQSYFRALVEDTTGAVHTLRPYLSKFLILDWREQVEEQTPDRREFMLAAFQGAIRDVREMQEAGVRIMAGSDVAVLNIFPGATLHDELELFVDSVGMTPMEALVSATRSPAEWLGLADAVGTIQVGKIADLVLLDADPLADISNTKRIAAVVLRGTYYDRAGLGALLAAVDTMADQTVNDWVR